MGRNPKISNLPVMTAEDTKALLRAYNRDPFIDVLERFLAGCPDYAAIQLFAKTYPDKWANAVVAIARLSGYHDKLEVGGTIEHVIRKMSDSELLKKQVELIQELRAKGVDVIELAASAVEVVEEPSQEPVPSEE